MHDTLDPHQYHMFKRFAYIGTNTRHQVPSWRYNLTFDKFIVFTATSLFWWKGGLVCEKWSLGSQFIVSHLPKWPNSIGPTIQKLPFRPNTPRRKYNNLMSSLDSTYDLDKWAWFVKMGARVLDLWLGLSFMPIQPKTNFLGSRPNCFVTKKVYILYRAQ